MSTLPEQELLIKLNYSNGENASTALKDFCHFKKQRREPISEITRKDMLVKLE